MGAAGAQGVGQIRVVQRLDISGGSRLPWCTVHFFTIDDARVMFISMPATLFVFQLWSPSPTHSCSKVLFQYLVRFRYVGLYDHFDGCGANRTAERVIAGTCQWMIELHPLQEKNRIIQAQ
jgi:hypothetical protein